jgi:hypothetical protein
VGKVFVNITSKEQVRCKKHTIEKEHRYFVPKRVSSKKVKSIEHFEVS